jgi:dipeptidase D
LRNAIAREAFALGAVPSRFKEEVRVAVNLLASDVEQELRHSDPGVHLSLGSAETPEKLFSEEFQGSLLNALYACPHGVMAMSHEIIGLVETSTNLASVSMKEGRVLVTTSQRSSVESAKTDLANMVSSVFELAGAQVEHSDGYPGWEPDMNSQLLDIARASYQHLFKNSIQVKAIHAGLECGLFLEKYPGMDMISIGPTIKGAHSPDERLQIETVKKFWDHLLDILKNIPPAIN